MSEVNNNMFINRELSWLRFNSRVLAQCEKDIPLIEKLKFMAIYSTNLDEFYMIRVAGLKQLFIAGITASGSDEMTPLDQLREIRDYLSKEQVRLEEYYQNVVCELARENFFIKNYNDLDIDLRDVADDFFFSNIMPIIVPIAVDATHPFPHLNNLSFGLAVKLCDQNNTESIKFGMIRISRVLPRFVPVSENVYVPIETIVNRHVEEIFPGYSLISSAPFRVTRNADIIIEEEEADDFMMILEQGLKLRRKGAFVRLQIAKDADIDIVDFLNTHMKIFYKDIYEYNIPIALDGLWGVVGNKNFCHLALPPYTPKTLPPFDENTSVFESIDKEDVLIFHPYESFDPVTKLVKEASKDPKVVSIRMTLYRVEKNSPIIQALIDAANDGKQVTVMVELKARFDEENNLHWAKALENAGAHVIYGIAGFKVHAKITQIIRKNGDKLKFYIHLGTGNYNGSSAKIYTDISFFTTDESFVKDTTTFFHILSGYNKNRRLNTLSMSPMQIKERLIEMIKVEESKASEGHIIAKMNALVDSDMIKALCKASKAGVKVELIVRGICCLRPGIEGISDNIRVISIVGKYLEHARIFYFKHSLPGLYISSADWMPRNLERRLELMTPIYSEPLKEKLKDILRVQLSDTSLAYELQNDGRYIKVMPKDGENPINNQLVFENYFDKLYKSVKKHHAHDAKELLATKLLIES
ncbi:polyphosphate kinase [Campylobacter geochelonis]|uniref:Polyphosphate kinase n=1 Tax=Campylobacter geochelonis TaxID=1780362 RepID=A0A128EQH7_9BACT|nr:RNA degradosome polyphosphate kinase [Campylobacter geochelonis]QKF71617.1 polyphosphate kinase 1 [Campylobacter geochelonis]CZE48697.1 polyphosphate kinase [Campylobacter geochelonis]CZE48713.1 polyphosphate kinase [Campylobacter geochelonis]CZE51278.1 polyphosphate kinase [Campylobacter geochelonis]